MKLCKWHTIVFRCPCCDAEADYAAQIVEGEHCGSYWDPAYWCEQCKTPVRARDTWLFGAVYGPLMATIAALAWQALPSGWGVAQFATLVFTAVCCAIVGWPLSRTLTRYILYWEPRDSRGLPPPRLRRLRQDDD